MATNITGGIGLGANFIAHPNVNEKGGVSCGISSASSSIVANYKNKSKSVHLGCTKAGELKKGSITFE